MAIWLAAHLFCIFTFAHLFLDFRFVFRSLKGHVGGEEQVCVAAQRYFVKEYISNGGGGARQLIADDLVTLCERVG